MSANRFRRQKFNCPVPFDLLPVKNCAQKCITKNVHSSGRMKWIDKKIAKRFYAFHQIKKIVRAMKNGIWNDYFKRFACD